MPKLIKMGINSILAKFGYEVRRKNKPARSCNSLEIMMQGIIAVMGTINVVQVGANDGSHNDPIHGLLTTNLNHTRALLIEPQHDIIQYLKNAYLSHPDITIFNGAIGADEKLILYRIKPELWSSFHAPYLKNAPDYRAPSGLTSANKEHVLNAARKYLNNNIDAEAAIEEIQVPCRRLGQLLAEMEFPMNIHLLQVDAEGADDQVLYACEIEKLRPLVINFEFKHLTDHRREKLVAYLIHNEYKLFDWNASDTLAIRLFK